MGLIENNLNFLLLCLICTSFKDTWVHIIQSEVSQEEIDKYRINTYIWNPERWYRRIYLQGGSRETDIENRLMDVRKGEER